MPCQGQAAPRHTMLFCDYRLSRNQYLTGEMRAKAPVVYKALCKAKVRRERRTMVVMRSRR